MGAGSSVEYGKQQRRKSLVSKEGRVRQSILLTDDPKALKYVPQHDHATMPTLTESDDDDENEEGQEIPPKDAVKQGSTTAVADKAAVKQVELHIFQVQIPHGVLPGGTFSAVCNNRYVKIEVPEDCLPGDFIQIDLSGVDDQPASSLDGFTNDSPEQKLRRAAALFMKYDVDKNYCITMEQLEALLVTEFKFLAGSEACRYEMSYADVDHSRSLSFDEFCHWLEHLQIRLELKRLQEQHHKLDVKGAESTGPKEDGKLKELLEEQARLRKQAEDQMNAFMLEIEVLRKEKERLEVFKNNYVEDSDEYAELTNFEIRNDAKLAKMEQHQRDNQAMIEKMKADYMVLQNQREEDEQAQKEAQRKKLHAKMEERKRQKAHKDDHSGEKGDIVSTTQEACDTKHTANTKPSKHSSGESSPRPAPVAPPHELESSEDAGDNISSARTPNAAMGPTDEDPDTAMPPLEN